MSQTQLQGMSARKRAEYVRASIRIDAEQCNRDVGVEAPTNSAGPLLPMSAYSAVARGVVGAGPQPGHRRGDTTPFQGHRVTPLHSVRRGSGTTPSVLGTSWGQVGERVVAMNRVMSSLNNLSRGTTNAVAYVPLSMLDTRLACAVGGTGDCVADLGSD